MKKNIEWLRGRIKSFQEGENMFTDEFNAGVQDALEYVQELIDQLDEPETLSEEWIENHTASADTISYYSEENVPVVTVEKLKNLLAPKQDKPVIPQFVADYYKDYEYLELTFEEWFECEEFGKGGKTENKTFEWLLDNSREVNIERQFILADIIAHGLDGYEVEKEKKYQVIIRDGEYIRLYLCKHGDNVMIGTNDNYIEKCPEVTYLTEKEIKDYDERYWAFAKEVTQ